MRHSALFVTLLPTLLLLSACSEAPEYEVNWAQVPEFGFEHDDVVALGRLVLIDYELFEATPLNPNPELPSKNNFPVYKELFKHYTPLLNLQGNDNHQELTRVLYGHIWQDKQAPRHLIISLRGTDDSQEWVDDAKFEMVEYLPGNCCVELGFNEIHRSLTVTAPTTLNSRSADQQVALIDHLKTQTHINEITVVGHSLGSSAPL